MSALIIDTRPSDVAPEARVFNYTDLSAEARARVDVIIPVAAAAFVIAFVMGIVTSSVPAIIVGGFGAAVLTRAMISLTHLSAEKPTDR